MTTDATGAYRAVSRTPKRERTERELRQTGRVPSSQDDIEPAMSGDCHHEPSICPEWCVHKDEGLGYHRHSRMTDEKRHEWGLNDTPESRLYR